METWNWILIHSIILFVLEKSDPDYAYKLLLNEKKPGWLYMAKENTCRIWEGWEGIKAQSGIASLNHYSKGAMAEWLYKSMLGIKIKGENKFEISPVIGEGIEFAKGKYKSIYGEIAVSWKKDNNNINFDIKIPPNTKSTFIYKNKVEKLEPGNYQFSVQK